MSYFHQSMGGEDIPTPLGVLTDEQAAQIEALGGPGAAPPEMRDLFTAHMNQYRAFRQSAPRLVDVQAANERARKIEDLTLDFDAATKGVELRSMKFAPDEPTRQKLKKQLVVNAWIQQHAGQVPDGPMRDIMREAVANDLFGENKGRGSDDNFLVEAQKWATKQRDFRTITQGPEGDTPDALEARKTSLASLAAEAAMGGQDYNTAFSAWQNASKGKPGYDPAKLEDYETVARHTHALMRHEIDAVTPAVDEIFNGMLKEQDSSRPYGGDTLVEKLLTIPKEQRGLAMVLLSKKAEAVGAKEAAGSHIAQAFKRGMGEMFMGTFRTRELAALQEAEDKLSGLKPGQTYGGRFPDLMGYLRGVSSDSVEGRMVKGALEPFMTDKVVTQGDIDAAKLKIDQDREKLAVGMQLEQIAKGELDPIKSSGFWTKMGNGFAQSILPQLVTFAATRKIAGAGFAGAGLAARVGNLSMGAGSVPLLYGMMADQNTQQFMALNPGMTIKQASDMGRQASVFQTGLEYAQNLLTFGALPMLGKELKAARSAGIGAFAKGVAIHAASQNAIEGMQDVMPGIIQALRADAPGVPWERFFKGDVPNVAIRSEGEGDSARTVFSVAGKDFGSLNEANAYAAENRQGGYWADRVDTFVTLLPVVVFGAGGDVVRSRVSRANLEATAEALKDEVVLKSAGIPESERAAIMAETDAVKRLDMFSAAMPKADKEVAKQGAKELTQRLASQSGAFEKAMRENGIQIQRTGETITVIGPDGVKTDHATAQAAQGTIRSILAHSDMTVSQPVFDMLDALDSRPDAPTGSSTTTITAKQKSAADALLAAEESGNTQLADAMKNRMAVAQAATPDTPIDWSKMAFEGQSDLDVQESVHRAVTRIEEGSSALVPLEERAETDMESWLRTGKTSVDALAEMIRTVEAVTGDSYLSGYDGATPEQDKMAVKEAYSKLTTVYATARGRSGKVGQAARSERAAAVPELRQRLKDAESQGVEAPLFEKLQNAWAWFKQVMVQAAKLNKARRDGKLGRIEDFLNQSIGIQEESQAAKDVSLEAERLFNEGIRDDNTATIRPAAPAAPVVDTSTDDLMTKLGDGPNLSFLREKLDSSKVNLPDDLKKMGVLAIRWDDSLGGRFWFVVDSRANGDKLTDLAIKFGLSSGINEAGSGAIVNMKDTRLGSVADKLGLRIEAQPMMSDVLPPMPDDAESQYGFRLTPINTLEALSTSLNNRVRRDPEARRLMTEKALAALEKLKERWTTVQMTPMGDEIRPLVEKRSSYELNREQGVRQALAVEAALDRVWKDRWEILGDEGLAKFTNQPIAMQIMQPGRPPRGRLMSRSAAAKSHFFDDSKHGDFDGADGLPFFLFGGNTAPDQMAQELFEAGLIKDGHVDTMWEAIAKELSFSSKMKEQLKKAKAEMRDAREVAKKEAAEWRKEQDALQKQDWDPHAVLLRDLRMFDAIMSAFPAEVRAKVGGWISIAGLKTPDARLRELQSRLLKLDEMLEFHLKAEAITEIEALMEKAEPVRKPGQKPRGHLGAAAHRFFQQVSKLKDMTKDQVEKENAWLEKQLQDEDGTLTQEAALELFEKQQALQMFGHLKGKDSAELTRALELLESVYEDGRNLWTTLESARLDEVKGLVADTLKSLGYATAADKSKAEKAKQLSKITRATEKIKAGSLSLKSFRETLETMLGEGNPLVERWARVARRGFEQRTDEIMSTQARFNEALHAATRKRGVAARRQLWDMVNDKTAINITTQATITEKINVPIETIMRLRVGIGEAAALGLTAEDIAQVQDKLKALGRDHRREFIELERKSKGSVVSEPLSEAEAVFLSMVAKQAQYADMMAEQGFDADALAQIEDQLSGAAKHLRAFLANEYREGYAPLARLYEQMFGVALPQIKNYAPGSFYSTGTGDTALDVNGTGVLEGGFKTGMLSDRKAHKATAKRANAFGVFFAHSNQTAHWKALAPLTRELRGVFGNAKVKEAIAGRHGDAMGNAIQQWIEAIEGNGIKASWRSELLEKMISSQAYAALGWKLATLFKQSSALLGAWYRIPTGAYFHGLGRLMTGQLDVRKMWNDPIIQRRIQSGFTPEVRAAMSDIWNAPPNLRREFLEKGMELIGRVDAIFTTGSAAIAYDYHFRQAQKAGHNDTVAHNMAIEETADIVANTAQPADIINRSRFEMAMSGNSFGKLAFLYSSEARQKTSMVLTAWGHTLTGKATAKDARVLLISHLIVGPLIQAISSAWLDARDPDDDEWFDLDHWNPLDFLKAAALNGFSGIPLLRDVFSGFGDRGPLRVYTDALSATKKLLTGPENDVRDKADWYEKQLLKVLQGIGGFSATAGNVADQLYDIGDNLSDSSAEARAKEIAAKRKQLKDLKGTVEDDTEPAMTQEEKDKQTLDRLDAAIKRAQP